MKTMFNLVTATILLASSTQLFAAEQTTLVTLYNSETTQEGGASTIAVLRQIPRKAELFVCGKRYKGHFKDFAAAEAFFNEGLETVFKKRNNCTPYSILSNKDFPVRKNSINSNDGTPVRYVVTGSGANVALAEIMSDVTTWTIDVTDGLGINPEDEVMLVGARVLHSKLDNPTISTYRDSYKLSGMAQIQYAEIGK